MATNYKNVILDQSNTHLQNETVLALQNNTTISRKTHNKETNIIYRESFINCSFEDFKTHNSELSSYLIGLSILKKKSNHLNLIDLKKGHNFTLRIYQLKNSPLEQKDLPSIDFSMLLEQLNQFKTEIIVFQCDINRIDEVTHQTEYKLYSLDGLLLNMSAINENINRILIKSPIINMNNSSIKTINFLAQQGMNASGKSSPLFNDICFKFRNDNGINASIQDRRNYYPQKELCETNCSFISLDNDTYDIKCSCLIKTNFSDIIISNPLSSPLQSELPPFLKEINCPSQLFLNEIKTKTYSNFFILSIILIIALFGLYYVKNSVFLIKQFINSYFSSSIKNKYEFGSKLPPIILPCPPKSEKSGYQTPNKSVDTHIEEESFGEIKINNFQDKESSPLRQNYLNRKGGNGDNTKNITPEEISEKALIEKLKKSLMNPTGENANENLNRYFFTRNSDNESNPNYSKKYSTEMNLNDFKSGRSLTHFNNYDNKRTRDMLRYNDYDEESEKRGLANFNSKVQKKGLVIKDDDSQDSQLKHEGRPFSVQHEISVSIQNPDKEDDELIYGSYKKKGKKIKQKASNSGAIEVNNQEKTKIEEPANPKVSFCKRYHNYIKRREIFFITFCSKKQYLPFFIKFPIFLFCLTITFTIHSLLFLNKFLEGRFEASRNNGSITKYWFTDELPRCLYTAIIVNVVKMIIVKLLLFYVFRIEKKILSRENYRIILNRLRCRSATVFIVLLVLMFGLFYINTCYCGIFPNTQDAFFIGYVVTIFFSFVFCLIICLLINVIGLIGVKCNFS